MSPALRLVRHGMVELLQGREKRDGNVWVLDVLCDDRERKQEGCQGGGTLDLESLFILLAGLQSLRHQDWIANERAPSRELNVLEPG